MVHSLYVHLNEAGVNGHSLSGKKACKSTGNCYPPLIILKNIKCWIYQKKTFNYCIDSKEAPFLVQTDMFFLQPAKTHEAIKVYNTGVDRSYVTFQHLLSDCAKILLQ